MTPKSAQITRLTPEQLAELLSISARQKVTEAQVCRIAETAGIRQPDGTINLVEYAAFLISELSHVRH